MDDFRYGFDEWEKMARSFGLGSTLGIDLNGEKDCNVPDVKEYDQIYGLKRWNYRTIYSLSIGQGEFSLTPLQMANIAAAIANKGHYFTPHLVKAIGDSTLNYKKTKKKTLVNPEYFDIVHEGMQWVIEESGGTARRAKIDSKSIFSKTPQIPS